ncbi:MAG: dihydroorotate dehydrogenase-like protein [Bacteroidetes bacterium]|nr:dihydroorotate dehydrogenase-like protein [Bacteroidota bacterium]MBT5528712.1 dihydroorotate dehydrogenase-like protein [Cytophagia bacterium]MBT3422488.1 dihydroorotate dehydrogenase-like protein [Bacteroidota bacterium]MBT3934082.1 dihydroorotate dehydrogenase-like protein [Bacteroidota bacterium]MBT4337232.1 dihydroorotate dehydrogenase-like protein [Bacteroidota bacterium]
MDLKTTYMGIELKNPLIVGASNLVTDHETLKELENAGAAAIVYKSLFEEQIQIEELEFEEEMAEYNERHAEMINLFPSMKHAGPKEHLMNLKKAKEILNIPLIASLNCVYEDTWIDYVEKIQETGVDGIELNFYAVPKDLDTEGHSIETAQINMLKKIKEKIKIPFSVKLSPFYSNPLNVIAKMDEVGVGAFVLFNKLFQPDFNIENNELVFPYNLSNPDDNRLALRYAGLLYNQINANICSNTGVYTGKDAIKMILAGADSVQIVSTLYKNKVTYIKTMLEEIEAYMQSKNYYKLDDFKGKLSKKSINDPYAYKRAQYVDILMKSDHIFKKYSPR